MFDAGMTPLAALQSISSTAAALLNHSDDIGQIAPGFVGDFIAVDENPLKNIEALRNISLVTQAGRVVRNSQRILTF